MRQPLVSAPRRHDRESGCTRPVDEFADQRGLVAVGQAVDDALLGRLAREQGAAERVRLDRDIDHMLALAKRFQAMLDRGDRIAGALDDDVDARMPHQRLPVVAHVRLAGGERVVERLCGVALGLPTHALEIGPRAGRRQVRDANQVHAWRARNLREIHRAELPGADQPDAQGISLLGALEEFGVEAHRSTIVLERRIALERPAALGVMHSRSGPSFAHIGIRVRSGPSFALPAAA